MKSCSVGGDSAVAKHVGCFLLSGNVQELVSFYVCLKSLFRVVGKTPKRLSVCCLSTIYCGNQSVWRHKDGLHFVFVYECDKVSFWMKARGSVVMLCIVAPAPEHLLFRQVRQLCDIHKASSNPSMHKACVLKHKTDLRTAFW